MRLIIIVHNCFEIIFELCRQRIIILQNLTNRLLPKFLQNSNKKLVKRIRKTIEFRKRPFDRVKDGNRNFCQARMKVYYINYICDNILCNNLAIVCWVG